MNFRWRVDRVRVSTRARELEQRGERSQAVDAALASVVPLHAFPVAAYTLLDLQGEFSVARLLSLTPTSAILDSRSCGPTGAPVTLTLKSPAGELIDIPGVLEASVPGRVSVRFASPSRVVAALIERSREDLDATRG
jgi:hypothetical protein